MYRKRIFLAALALFMILGMFGSAFMLLSGRMSPGRTSDEWMQGYMMGRMEADGEGSAAAPYRYYSDFRGSGRRHFGFIPMLCGMGLFLLGLPLLLAGGMFWRHRAEKMAHGPHGKHHGPTPPWFCGEKKPSEEEMEKMKQWFKRWQESAKEPSEQPSTDEPR